MRIKKGCKLRKTFFLYCEGETEEGYFNALKGKYRNIKIHPKTLGQVPTTKDKIRIFKKSLFLKSGYSVRNFEDTKSHIYVILDIDVYSQIDIDLIKSELEDTHITLICSNNDFELWILLHYSYYKKADKNYQSQICTCSGRDYRKGKSFNSVKLFEEIIQEKLEVAQHNALKLVDFHKKQNNTTLKTMLPYTEVYKIIGELNK